MSADLSRKSVILTGASGGQGRVAARMMVEAGANVALCDIDPAGEASADDFGAAASFHRLDVTDAAAWSEVVAAMLARTGRVDALVNNAGLAGRDSVAQLSVERLRRYLDVNLVGALNGMQAVLPAMRAAGKGAIVNVASISALQATPGLVGYGVSKWALRGLSRNAAVEFGPMGIRVNAVMPGAVDVTMIRDDTAAAGKQDAGAMVPLGRVARAGEVASAVFFLASDASSYMNGAEVVVDGGWTA